MDLFFSFFGLAVFAPVIFLAAIMIKINSTGPIIYRQERAGKNGRVFTMYKIRTMIEDAEEGTGPVWAKKADVRIVRGGDFLRKYHIDELPQLFNVLKGDMSLVGPRPERPEIVEHLYRVIPNYYKKMAVKPGITGYAQIRHKYDETIKDVVRKLRYELFYIDKACCTIDIRILLDTIALILSGRDQYYKRGKLAHA